MPSSLINYSTRNSEQNWENFYIQLGNQQTCVFDKHNKMREVQFPNPNKVDASLLIFYCNMSFIV